MDPRKVFGSDKCQVLGKRNIDLWNYNFLGTIPYLYLIYVVLYMISVLCIVKMTIPYLLSDLSMFNNKELT